MRGFEMRVSGTLIFVYTLFILMVAQRVSCQTEGVTVSSWMTGNGTISEKLIELTLNPDIKEYRIEATNDSKTKPYEIRLTRTLSSTALRRRIPCWIITMSELTTESKSGGQIVGENLLSGPGGGDEILKGDFADMLCYIEPPSKPLESNFFPFTFERTFLIEKFQVSVRVTDYMVDKTSGALSRVDLRLELKNREPITAKPKPAKEGRGQACVRLLQISRYGAKTEDRS